MNEFFWEHLYTEIFNNLYSNHLSAYLVDRMTCTLLLLVIPIANIMT